jgi:hypothetical protein
MKLLKKIREAFSGTRSITGSNSAITERPTPQTDPWRWMETWMLAHDKATGTTKGKEVMDWVWQADTGC